MKDLRNVQNEYGFKLRWINGGGDENGTWDYRYFLEKENGTRTEIINQDAIKFIESQTLPTFRSDIKGYNAYIKLFEILGIAPSIRFAELLLKFGMSTYKLAKLSGVSQPAIQLWKTGDRDPKVMSLENANKIASALSISIDELFQSLQ